MKQNVPLRYINLHKQKYYEEESTAITDIVFLFFIIIIVLGETQKITTLTLL